MQRLLFGTGTAYVQQLEQGEDYELLKPVYGLGLIASVFDNDSPAWYHHYKLVNVEDTQREIKDLQLIFIELPKFKAASVAHKKLQVLWLRFMMELNDKTREIPAEWLNVPEIKEAVALSEAAAYGAGEMEAYNRYWDAVSTEKTLLRGKFEEGKAEGRVEGVEATLKAIELLRQGQSIDAIAQTTKLNREVIENLQKQISD